MISFDDIQSEISLILQNEQFINQEVFASLTALIRPWANSRKVEELYNDIFSSQRKYGEFYQYGQFASDHINIYQDSSKVLLFHYWEDEETAIHGHQFEGFFTPIKGKIIEHKYNFSVDKLSSCRELAFGEAKLINERNLETYKSVKIEKNNLHKVYYLDESNITMCLRDREDNGRVIKSFDHYQVNCELISNDKWKSIRKQLNKGDYSLLAELSLGQCANLLTVAPPDGEKNFKHWFKLNTIIRKRIQDEMGS